MTHNFAARFKSERFFRLKPGLQALSIICILFGASLALAEESIHTLPTAPLPDVSFSLLRLLGALVLVIALFLGGVWVYKNWQRLAIYKGRAPKLNVLEVKSLGSRHALYLIGYDEQRFLIASSPAGINLLTHLPEAVADIPLTPTLSPNGGEGDPASGPTFAQRLRHAVFAKP